MSTKAIATLPAYLIYEEMDGKPLYYKDYQEIVQKRKKITDVIGSSGMQVFIVGVILKYLYTNLSLTEYFITSNEVGLHISKGNNLAADIAIYHKSKLTKKRVTDKYLTIPPKIVIEVDAKIEVREVGDGLAYIHQKTQKLLDFGVEKVIWILSNSKQVIIATPNQSWILENWIFPITVVNDKQFVIQDLLDKEEL